MQIIDFQTDSVNFQSVIARCCTVLENGELLGIPTETVYGLAGDATNGQAVAKIFELKQRPQFNPLIAHVSGLEMAQTLGQFCESAQKLASEFWPGPLTLVVPQLPHSPIHDLVSAGLSTIAMRCPGGPARQLIEAYGKPLAAPSANRSGKVSPSCADHVASEFPANNLLILDGGPCTVGLESTIAKIEQEQIIILRTGSIGINELAAVTSLPVIYASKNAELVAPGMMVSHYAPRAKVIANCKTPPKNGILLGYGPQTGDMELNLSPKGNLHEAASNLYAYLRQLDDAGHDTICIAPIPDEGLGIAINDRIKRAAAPRQNSGGT